MPQKNKIVGELASRVLELHDLGLSSGAIRKELLKQQVSLSRMTITSFLDKNKIIPNSRQEVVRKNDYDSFIEEVKNGVPWNIARKKYGISTEKAKKIQFENGIKPTDRKDSAQRRSLTSQDILSRVGDDRVKLIKTENGRHHFELDGKEFSKTTNKLVQGVPFGKCGKVISEAEYRDRLSEAHYRLISDFKSMSDHVTVVCQNGHERTCKEENVLKQDCGDCALVGISKEEMGILAWIRAFYPSAHKLKLKEDGKLGKKKEIDIFIPEINLGIEYCGLYWHSSKEDLVESITEDIENKESSKHYKKTLLAKSQGIKLITIFSDEWKDRRDQIKSFLISSMRQNSRKINARECEIKEVASEDCTTFLNLFHIQGNDKTTQIRLGIYLKAELIGVMTAGIHPWRANTVNEMYLTRMCFKTDITVRGGATKLLSSLKKIGTKLKYDKIVSWSDNRWSDGNAYSKMGFGLDVPKRSDGRSMGLVDGSIWPEKLPILNGKVISKQSLKKLSPDQTKNVRYIYDCGKKRWSLPLIQPNP